MKILDVLTAPWAISPEKLTEIKAIYRAHFKGEKIDWKAMEAKAGLINSSMKDAPLYDTVGDIAVLDVTGVLTKGMSFFSFLFGGTSMQHVADAFVAALADVEIKSIMLHIDSPGGTVDGTQELADLIFAARGQKPSVAYCDGQICSAAYWIGSAADSIYISGDTVMAGSIGVVATHVDVSKQDEMFGEKITEITAGKYKRIASNHAPLSPEGRQSLQDIVDHLYSVFIENVSKNRGVSEEQALAMADGKLFFGKQAVDIGLVDGVATYGRLINKMTAGDAIIKSEEEVTMKDLKELQEKFPEIYKAAVDAGKAEAQAAQVVLVDDAKAEAVKTGIKQESERIKKILVLATPGHEKIISEAIADSSVTDADVALKIVAADKVMLEAKVKALKDDAEAAGKVAAAGAEAINTVASVDPNLPVEERAKLEWDKDPKIRAEFGKIEVYTAYKKAAEKGLIKILGGDKIIKK
jgi:signal peptide peptidase SppA